MPTAPDPVLAEDADTLYLLKPAGLPTLPPNDGAARDSLAARLLAHRPEQGRALPADLPEPLLFAAGILHRLDTWTSGLVLAARSPAAFARGRAAFAEGRLRKHYRFLTDRRVPWTVHRVEHPLAHDKRRKRRMVWRRGANTPHRGRWYPAVTELRRLGAREGATLWEAVITTGVTHQVRVHAASVGLPLLGDREYGGTPLSVERFYLHHHHVKGWPGEPPSVPLPEDWP